MKEILKHGGGGGGIGQVWNCHFRSSRACPTAFLGYSVLSVGLWPLACCIVPRFQSLPPWLWSGLWVQGFIAWVTHACGGDGGMVGGKRDKIRSGYITPAFFGAHKWAELLHNPCILGGPEKRGQNQKWLHNSAFAKEFHEGWKKKGGETAPPLLSSGSYLATLGMEPWTFRVQVQCSIN